MNDIYIKLALMNKVINTKVNNAIKDYQIVVDKYEIITKEKNDCLGTTMVLKDLCDLYWKRIDIYDKQRKYIAYCYKDKDAEYYCSDEISLDQFKQLLKLTVNVSDIEIYDEQNFPVICVYLH